VKGAVPFSRLAFDPAAMGMNTPVEDRPAWAARYLKERDDFLAADQAFYTGRSASGDFVEKIPAKFDLALVERGQLKYNIYCSACHSYTGDGKGTVGTQWSYPLPNFHDDKYKTPDPNVPKPYQHLDGYLFHTIRNGVPETAPEKTGQYKMPPYAYQVSESDAWAIVAYVRSLQLSRAASQNDVPADKVRDLENMRRPSGTPAAPATTPMGKTGGQP
jgi:mono/diheme cytochrome c family protein